MLFGLPHGLPLPRRLVILIGTLVAMFLLLNTFAPSTLPPAISSYPHHNPDSSILSPAKWIPPIIDPSRPDRPAEFDEHGRCVFLSAYDALSPAEKLRAEAVELTEVSKGVVALGSASNATGSTEMSHPILALLRQGERKWNDMLQSQSKTLEQAVRKYEARWGRPPPKGFDDWWQFATSRDTLLTDEFDSIMESLLPYWGLPVAKLAERLKQVEDIPETFTLIVIDKRVEVKWNDNYSRDTWWASRPRADAQTNLMEEFIHLMPDFRATFSIHDQPSIMLDYERNKELVDAAKLHRVSNQQNEVDRFEQNWRKACAPNSLLNLKQTETPAADTFVSNHLSTMNPCDHPSLMENHGMLLEAHNEHSHPKPHTKLYPIFVPSKTVLNGDIPITPVGRDGRRDDVGHDPAWTAKSGKLYWRGLSTGMSHDKGNGAKWRQSHRERLHFLANDRTSGLQDVLVPKGSTGEAELNKFGRRTLGQYYMDVKIAGGPWQCDNDDGTCNEMKEEISFASKDSPETSNQYKYILDTDGNAWSSRFPRLLASLNVVIKATLFPEWNTRHLPEWFAYVPTKMDYSDLFSIIAFFRGTPSGKGAHDEVARRIALNGQCWVERTWRKEDLQIYMLRLYLEYARLVSPDRDNGKMDFVLQDYHRDPPSQHKAQNGEEQIAKIEAMPGIDQ